MLCKSIDWFLYDNGPVMKELFYVLNLSKILKLLKYANKFFTFYVIFKKCAT